MSNRHIDAVLNLIDEALTFTVQVDHTDRTRTDTDAALVAAQRVASLRDDRMVTTTAVTRCVA
jgi:hypothetical protein